MKRPYFNEEQNMDRSFLILLLVSAGMTLFIVLAVTLTEQDSDVFESMLFIGSIVMVYGLIFWLMNSMKLFTKVDRDGIHMRFPPFRRSWKTFAFSEIDKFEVKRGKLLTEFGGWGYAKGFGKKKSYTAKGDYGVLMNMKTGKIIFIGTQEPKMLERALQKAKGNAEES